MYRSPFSLVQTFVFNTFLAIKVLLTFFHILKILFLLDDLLFIFSIQIMKEKEARQLKASVPGGTVLCWTDVSLNGYGGFVLLLCKHGSS